MENILQIPSDIPSSGRHHHHSHQSTPTRSRHMNHTIDNRRSPTLSKPKPALSGYKFGRIIGQGGYGKVYECTRISSRNKKGAKPYMRAKKVAIKVISVEKIVRKDIRKRVVKEVEVHLCCDHDNIVKLIDYEEDRHYVYMVMEYCGGGDLYKMFRDKQANGFSEFHAAKLISQLASGIAYLHSNNTMHRDLKLSNLLLTEHGDLKIGDFGLAVLLESPSDEHYTMCGTPNYIAPEVASVSKKQHGMPIDLWAIGVVLYSLIVGRLPFKSDTSSGTLDKVRMLDYKIPNKVSPLARDLIQKLIVEDPDERLSAEDILRHRFILKHCGTIIRSTNNRNSTTDLDAASHARKSRNYANSLFTQSFSSSISSTLSSVSSSNSSINARNQFMRSSVTPSSSLNSEQFLSRKNRRQRQGLRQQHHHNKNRSSTNSNENKIQRRRSDSLETDSTGPSTPVFSGASSSIVSTSLQNRMEDLDLLNTSKQGQEYFRKSYASSRGSNGNTYVNKSNLSASVQVVPAIEKFHREKKSKRNSSSVDLLFEAKTVGVNLNKHSESEASFKPRKNKHKPRKLIFGGKESQQGDKLNDGDDDEDCMMVDNGDNFSESNNGDDIGVEEGNIYEQTEQYSQLPVIHVHGLKDFKFDLEDGSIELKNSKGTLNIIRHDDGSRLCINILDYENGIIEVYLPSGELSGIYKRHLLPIKYHPIYRLGWKINEIVRATTPHLTVHDKLAGITCTLMSNDPYPNFDFRQRDGGCVRLNVLSTIARIRTPRGEWFSVKLNNQQHSKNLLPRHFGDFNENTVDVDFMWLPNLPQPPGWFEMFSKNSTTTGSSIAGQQPINFVARYCLTILQKAQQALEYCLQLARNKMAETGNEATTDGWLPKYPFPMTLNQNIFSNFKHNADKEIQGGPESKMQRTVDSETTDLVKEVKANASGILPETETSSVSKTNEESLEMYLFGDVDCGNDNDKVIDDENTKKEVGSSVVNDSSRKFESIGERVLDSFSISESDNDKNEQNIMRLLNVGWVHQSINGLFKFDFEDGISMMYDPKENKPVTYLDVLRGPAEKYDLLRDDGTDLMENVPTYVRNKMDLIKESYPDFF